MKAAFFGTSAFAVPALQRLAAQADVVAVITQPDRPAGRGHKLAGTPVKVAAQALGLPVLTPEKLRPFGAELSARGVERCVVASYGRIIPQVLLDAVPLWLNVHPSLLPLYRGATPIQSAIRDGRTATAVSIIAMDAGMDTGDLLAQTEPLAIAADETYGELHDRLAAAGAELLADTLRADAQGALRRVSQAERAAELGISAAEIAQTATRPWDKADRAIDAGDLAQNAVNRIRALAPAPGALLPGEPPLKVLRAHASYREPHAAELAARAADGWVILDEVQPAGKGPMSGAAYLRGRRA